MEIAKAMSFALPLAKSFGYTVLAALCLWATWRSLSGAFSAFETDGQIFIAPFEVVDIKNSDDKRGIILARLLQAHLQQLVVDLTEAKAGLRVDDHPRTALAARQAASADLASSRLGLRLFPTEVVLRPSMLSQLQLDVTVKGVKVDGLFDWAQRALKKQKTLNLVLYANPTRTVVTGALDAVGIENGSLRVELAADADLDAVASQTAHELVRRLLGEDQRSQATALSTEEFKSLVAVLKDAASINQMARLGRPTIELWRTLLPRVTAIARKAPGWYQLNCLAAEVADQGDEAHRALPFYQKVKMSITDVQGEKDLLQYVDQRTKALTEAVETELEVTVEQACSMLRELFGCDVANPSVRLVEPDILTAYWTRDDKTIHVPPQAVVIPDIVYYECVRPFVENIVDLKHESQSGAIYNSYADIFAVVVTQRSKRQDAAASDWVLAPGAIAWLRGDDVTADGDRRPLRSLAAPGTAYDDPIIGKDMQVGHMQDYVKTDTDHGGVHINNGIPNKAFCQTAKALETPLAAAIWIRALRQIKPDASFQDLADETIRVADGDPNGVQALVSAWHAVGIHPAQKDNDNAVKED
jgi:hypothetical protein